MKTGNLLRFNFGFIFFTILLLFFPNRLTAQWVLVDGPYSNICYTSIRSLASNETNLFAATPKGVYTSTDYGKRWRPANNGLSSYEIYSINVNGANLYAGTADGLFHSTNNGLNWTNLGLSDGISSLLVKGSYLIVSTWGGMYKSSDNGATWEHNTGPYARTLILSGENIFAATDEGVYMSSDNGISWRTVNNGLSDHRVYSLAVKGINLFAGTRNGIFLSTNNGTNWSTVGLQNKEVYALISNGQNLFAGLISGGVYLSTNNGQSWSQVNTGLKGSTINTLAKKGTDIFAGTDVGVFLSSNSGTNWTGINYGFDYNQIKTLYVNEKNLFALTDDFSEPGLYRSSNYGQDFEMDTLHYVYGLAVSGNKVYAGSYFGVFLSTNYGTNWKLAGLTNKTITSLAADENYLFVGTSVFYPPNESVYHSTNDGLTWDISLNTSGYNLFINGENVFSTLVNDIIYRSTNHGLNWTSKILDVGFLQFTSFAVIGNNLFVAGKNGISLSTNNGETWGVVNTSLKSILSMVAYGINLIAATENGIFLSTDNGSSWSEISNELPIKYFNALAIMGTDLFVGSHYRGIWRRPLSEFTSVNDQNIVPIYSLSQNYPNPFNPSTTIKYSIPETGLVTLKVFNILGKEISTLINEEKSAGEYNVQFDATNLPSGVYIYKLQAGGFTETKKLLLLK